MGGEALLGGCEPGPPCGRAEPRKEPSQEGSSRESKGEERGRPRAARLMALMMSLRAYTWLSIDAVGSGASLSCGGGVLTPESKGSVRDGRFRE